MDTDRWQRVEQLCHAALEREKSQQAAFLEIACAGDETLRREVETLLAHRTRAEDFIEMPALEIAGKALAKEESSASTRPSRLIGQVLSDYRIVEKLGGGGMGEVYKAVRADGTYEKQVAIKLVQSGLSTDFFLTRFKNERQILASLDHPNIARLIDGGSTNEGLPYVVMEYIEGQPIDEYCEQRSLGIPERLKLFRIVCAAVHYAHKNLVVHRDLKPANILVASDGVPKLLDFGIATILHAPRETPQTRTITFLPLMTPDYASPEQVRNEAITTSSDVYSLGVILYVLLTGHHPFGNKAGTPHELIRSICETEPTKPSIAVALASRADAKAAASSTIPPGIQRDDGSKKLRRALAGDLDNIVLKALRKEPERRFASVEQFSEDIRRHLIGLPVIAHKDTLGYRSRKFVSRHKLGVGAVSLVIISLVAGLMVTLREARIARFERARAERRFNDVRALANSLIFDVHDSIRQLPGATAARKLIIQRAQQYLDGLAQESRHDTSLLRELAGAYGRLADVQGNVLDVNVGDTASALKNYQKARELLETAAMLEPSNRDTRRQLGRSYINLAVAVYQAGNKEQANQTMRRSLEILEPLAAADQGDLPAQAALGDAYLRIGAQVAEQNDLSGAKGHYERALAVFQQLAKADPQDKYFQTELSFSHKHLGSLLAVRGQLEAGLEHYQAALAIDEQQLKLDPGNARARYNITFAYSDTGWILGREGKFDTALEYYRKASDIRAALAAADPLDTRSREGLSNTWKYLGDIYALKGDFPASIDYYKKALALRQSLSEKDPANERLRFELAESEVDVGNLYATMASKERRRPDRELAFCHDSEMWLQKALPVFLARKKQGKLAGNQVNVPEQITQNLEGCRQRIAQLKITGAEIK